MKIEKLYTLSQFINWVDETDHYPFLGYDERYFLILKYNDFLKQLLKKEMFVNLKEPNAKDFFVAEHLSSMGNETYHEKLEKWQQAEKKVIFKKCEYYEDEKTINIKFINEYQFAYWKDDNPTLQKIVKETNGELELQNVEL